MTMIIVSNSKVSSQFTQGAKLLSYNKFVDMLFSDDGFSEEGDLYVNINEITEYDGVSAEEIFQALLENGTEFFSTNQEAPEFSAEIIDSIHDWYDEEVDNEDRASQEAYEQNTVDYQQTGQMEGQNIQQFGFSGDPLVQDNIANLINESANYDDSKANTHEQEGQKEAKIILFGSSKGGTGKTFTAVISTYRFAKTHPDKKIALVDFDLIDGQLGITLHTVRPTLREYYNSYLRGVKDAQTMQQFSVKGNSQFPQNVDCYLAPNSGSVIKNDDFWFNVIENLTTNYDYVIFDSGIDYLNIRPIAYAYMCADKINLVTTTSIKSVTSVTKQISKLKGENANPTYTKEADLARRINIIITQMIPGDETNSTIYSSLNAQAPVIATFGNITNFISSCEYYGMWTIFDDNDAINAALDTIMSLPEE